jgi:mannosyltransferase
MVVTAIAQRTPGAPVPPATEAAATSAADRRLEAVGTAVALGILAVVAITRLDATALWLDEAYSLGAANHLGDSLRQTSGTMGGYYALLAGWASLGAATWWLRLLSVVFAAGTLLVLRPVARRIGGPRLVAIALPLAALNPAFAAKAVEARSYALVGLLTAVTWWVVLRAIDAADPLRSRWLWLLAPLAVAGTLCHGLFLVQFAAVAVVLCLLGRPVRAVTTIAVLSVPAAGLVLLLRANGADSIGTTISGGPGVMVASAFDVLLAQPTLARLVLAPLVAVGIALAARDALQAAPSPNRAVAAVPAAWALVPCLALASFVFDPVFNPRYLAPVAPGIALLLGALVVAGDDAVARARHRPCRALGPLSLVLVLGCAAALVATPPALDHHWREAAGHVAAEARAGDGIVFANQSTREPVQQRPPFEAAWREVDPAVVPTAISPPRPLAEVRRMDEPLSLDELGPAAGAVDRVWVIEDQAPGVRMLEPVLDELTGTFREVERTTFAPGIVVVLLERR